MDLRPMYGKYEVRRADRRDEPGEKHADCKLFVLDLTHDVHARAALQHYGRLVATDRPALKTDIEDLLQSLVT